MSSMRTQRKPPNRRPGANTAGTEHLLASRVTATTKRPAADRQGGGGNAPVAIPTASYLPAGLFSRRDILATGVAFGTAALSDPDGFPPPTQAAVRRKQAISTDFFSIQRVNISPETGAQLHGTSKS